MHNNVVLFAMLYCVRDVDYADSEYVIIVAECEYYYNDFMLL